MAKATAEEIQQLERDHKAQFVDLVLANRLFIKLLPKIRGKAKTSKEYQAVLNFGKTIARLVGSWYVRQKDYEDKAGIPKSDPNLLKYFLVPSKQNNLIAQAKQYLDPKQKENQILSIYGIGIIPLIIWAIIAIVAAYTAKTIADHINTTAAEKEDLLKQTEATLKDLNISGPQAANIISSTQAQVPSGPSSLTSGFGNLLLWGGLAFVAIKFMGNKQPEHAK